MTAFAVVEAARAEQCTSPGLTDMRGFFHGRSPRSLSPSTCAIVMNEGAGAMHGMRVMPRSSRVLGRGSSAIPVDGLVGSDARADLSRTRPRPRGYDASQPYAARLIVRSASVGLVEPFFAQRERRGYNGQFSRRLAAAVE